MNGAVHQCRELLITRGSLFVNQPSHCKSAWPKALLSVMPSSTFGPYHHCKGDVLSLIVMNRDLPARGGLPSLGSPPVSLLVMQEAFVIPGLAVPLSWCCSVWFVLELKPCGGVSVVLVWVCLFSAVFFSFERSLGCHCLGRRSTCLVCRFC